MMINFHIDQIKEIMKYLDELPHKYARGLIEYIQAHVQTQMPSPSSNPVTETEQADKIVVTMLPADENTEQK